MGKQFDVAAMRKKDDVSAKAIIITMMIVFLVISGMFVYCFFGSIKAHSEFALEYDDLRYADLTFNHYERVGVGKSGHEYKIYFKEYAEPFQVDQITVKKFNEKELKRISDQAVLRVYYQESFSKKYEYRICEMHHENVALLTLDDYIRVNQNNQVIGMIVAPILALCGLFLAGMCIFGLMFQYKGRSKHKFINRM